MAKFDIYETITQKIIDSLDNGIIPWVQPWNGTGFHIPKNYKTGKAYRGINIPLLIMAERSNSYWMTFKQAQSIGGKVKKGATSQMIVYCQILEVDAKKDGKVLKDEKGNVIKDTIPKLRYSYVFNLDDIEGYKEITNRVMPEIKPVEEQFQTIEECENIIKQMKDSPVIKHEKNKACYVPTTDHINMPNQKLFKSNHGYYATLFHELTHSTGHKNRLDRKLEKYHTTKVNRSKEEMIAELGACFLCAHAGIANDKVIENTSSYIQSWVAVLKNDKKFIVKASSDAQKAVSYILGE